MNAVLKYPGAKWALAEQIISRFPEHHSYLEPFFGSGAVLFRKPRSPIETVNDLDGEETMERLTSRCDGRPALAQGLKERFTEQSLFFMLLNRLAAYEDTGLEPEEVAELVSPKTVEIARLLEKMCEEGSAQHMVELFQAEKDGRLVVMTLDKAKWIGEILAERERQDKNGAIHRKIHTASGRLFCLRSPGNLPRR